MIMDQELKTEVDQACRTAEDFTKHYYESMDKRRHLILRMYMDTSVLVWNGTGTTGKEAIGKFLIDLPVSEHSLWSLDAQRVLDQVSNKLAFLIKVTGSVKFSARGTKPFTQTFMITTQDDKWKIVSDCYRFQELLS
ncbi:NTF2-related export protein isoform X2 [Halyomorpha halys]|uniref:NTF2-related export protein isoform X2 n=1 Tax=Halyomorpha halys TaxID=286706 RepID=UPI0006D522ED|nr:NTF2-related export protein isoform X2 [Halyomorpha halys]